MPPIRPRRVAFELGLLSESPDRRIAWASALLRGLHLLLF